MFMINQNNSALQFNIFENPIDYVKLLGEHSLAWKGELLMNYENPQVAELVDKLAGPGIPYNVFDTTCHIMAELSGIEKNNMFVNMQLDVLAKRAFDRSKHELKDLDVEESAIGAVAFWNLLLPEKQGGVYPNEHYDDFLSNLSGILENYKLGNETLTIQAMQFPANILNELFLNFKNLASAYYAIKPRPTSLSELLS